MHGTFFDIGLGVGLAVACGLRPFLPLLLAGALGSGAALAVAFDQAPFRFLEAGWWLVVVAVALAAAYAVQLLLGFAPTLESDAARARSNPLAVALTGVAYAAGAALFAGTLATHNDAWWPGIVGGVAAVAVAQGAVIPLIGRVRARLPDRAARDALTLYLDLGSLLVAGLVALLHPLGYVALAAFGWLLVRSRSRMQETYGGLRILRR